MKHGMQRGAVFGSTPEQPLLGVVEWFRPGEPERVERILADLQALGVPELRTVFSWADWHTPGGRAWYDWLLPRLARQVNLLLCFTCTPSSLGRTAKTSTPPLQPKDYADFIDQAITRYGHFFEWLELWNEPNNLSGWDWRPDPEWKTFSGMVGAAAFWAKRRGKRTVLAGTCPTDLNWLSLMCQRHVLRHIDAVGVQGFPGTWECDWSGWPRLLAEVRETVEHFEYRPQIWITEAGYSTWRHDEFNQLRAFCDVLDSPAQRVYWHAARDLHPDLSRLEGFHQDERRYHFGLTRSDGTRKLLYRIWAGEGIAGVRAVAAAGENEHEGRAPAGAAGRPAAAVRGDRDDTDRHEILIIGGAGFLGSHMAHRLLSLGKPVRIFDNLSRPGVEKNLQWLRQTHGDRLRIEIDDVRDARAVRRAVGPAERIFHFAACTAGQDPLEMMEVNVRGTLHLLEALRLASHPQPLVYASGAEVYGDLRDIELRDNYTRYEPQDPWLQCNGVAEKRPPDISHPGACAQSAADQYVLAYARRHRLPATVLRFGSLYGPRQDERGEHGWIIRFLRQTLRHEPILVPGDGKQVRDILFIDDAVNALLYAQKYLHALQGQAFNLGGGPLNTTSCNEVVNLIANLHGCSPEISYRPWWSGDRRYYVSNINAFRTITGWAPLVGVPEGIGRLYQWLLQDVRLAPPRSAVPLCIPVQCAAPAAVPVAEHAVS